MLGELVNIKGGKLTYGQRIELGDILSDERRTTGQKFASALRCMFGDGYKVRGTAQEARIFENILEGITFWATKENALLHYEPTPEEISAGCKQLSERLGNMSTIMALAHKFSKDPDEILQWEYGKVFGLLYADLEQYKYSRRLQSIIDAKYRTTGKSWKR